jgi:hypothetical protein
VNRAGPILSAYGASFEPALLHLARMTFDAPRAPARKHRRWRSSLSCARAGHQASQPGFRGERTPGPGSGRSARPRWLLRRMASPDQP